MCGVPVKVYILKGFDVVDGKDTEETLSCPHVLVPHGTVLFLTCSVQYVQQASLPIDHHLLPIGVLCRCTSIQLLSVQHSCIQGSMASTHRITSVSLN